MHRAAERDLYLLFRSGSSVGALALANVREVMRPLPVEPIANAPLFVLGVAIVRGVPSPVIDAAQLLQTHIDTLGATRSRYVSLRLGTRSVCLAVDAVLDVRRLPHDDLEPAPPLFGESNSMLLPLVGVLDAELLVVLDTARLISDSLWASMQIAETPQ